MPGTWECEDCGNVNPREYPSCLRCSRERAGAHDGEPTAESQTDYSAAEWRTLKLAPLWVFTAVARADGGVNDREVEALGRLVEGASFFDDALLREVMFDIGCDVQETFRQFAADGRDFRAGLPQVSSVLAARMGPLRARRFKVALLHIGREIARAASGGFLGLGKRLSEEEEAALGELADALGLDPKDDLEEAAG